MAKLLHIADWHVGRTLNSVSRREDHAAVLAEQVQQAADHKPDLILHAGDIFETPVPSQDAWNQAFNTLADMAAIAEVLIVGGNHDPVHSLAAIARALSKRVTVIARPVHPSKQPLPVYELADGTRIKVAAVPWIFPNRVVDWFTEGQQAASYQEKARLINQAYAEALTADYDASRDVLIYLSHEHLTGALMSGSERTLDPGHVLQADTTVVPHVSYAALGHIHKPQEVSGGAVYAGSPMALDYGEAGEAKSSVLVTVEPGRPAVIERLPLTSARPLAVFTGTLEQAAARESIPPNAILRAFVKVDEPVNDLADQLQELLPDVTLERVEQHLAGAPKRVLDADDVNGHAEPPVEALLADYLSEHGTKDTSVKPERVVAVFTDLLADVTALPSDDESPEAHGAWALLSQEPPPVPTAAAVHAKAVEHTDEAATEDEVAA